MRTTVLLLAGMLSACGLAGCTSTGDSGPNDRGLSDTFNPSNYRRSNDTNGTQTRPDVNRLYTQPSLPTISNRGF